MGDTRSVQGILSIGALICLVVGWFNLLTPQINFFLYNRLFYILIGFSFILQAPSLSSRNMLYPMYLAGALCIVGAFLPPNSSLAMMKTIGLFAGVIISIFNRPRIAR